MRSHRLIFSLAVTGISRLCLARDWVLRRVEPIEDGEPLGPGVSRHRIASGRNLLDAVLVRPVEEPVRAVVLICHGIAEIIDHWVPVQRLLAEHGAASLVFDYSGYGRSTGRVDAAQCERDAIAAFGCLRDLTGAESIAVVGFSLGSGIAAAVTSRIRPSRLVLCAGFTSFRAAAHSIGLPAGLEHLIPPLWHAEELLRDCSMPILVVHGEKDRLFPVGMAEELAACCNAESIIVPKLGHTEPFHRPQTAYWGPIVDWLEGQSVA
ncbi:MAG: alpha/beta fold hydrolase [Acidobacteriaceae bacterium]